MIIGILEIQSVSHKICLLTLKLDSSVFYCIIFIHNMLMHLTQVLVGLISPNLQLGLVWFDD